MPEIRSQTEFVTTGPPPLQRVTSPAGCSGLLSSADLYSEQSDLIAEMTLPKAREKVSLIRAFLTVIIKKKSNS